VSGTLSYRFVESLHQAQCIVDQLIDIHFAMAMVLCIVVRKRSLSMTFINTWDALETRA
jgi:hypothetical protein